MPSDATGAPPWLPGAPAAAAAAAIRGPCLRVPRACGNASACLPSLPCSVVASSWVPHWWPAPAPPAANESCYVAPPAIALLAMPAAWRRPPRPTWACLQWMRRWAWRSASSRCGREGSSSSVPPALCRPSKPDAPRPSMNNSTRLPRDRALMPCQALPSLPQRAAPSEEHAEWIARRLKTLDGLLQVPHLAPLGRDRACGQHGAGGSNGSVASLQAGRQAGWWASPC